MYSIIIEGKYHSKEYDTLESAVDAAKKFASNPGNSNRVIKVVKIEIWFQPTHYHLLRIIDE